MSPTAKVKSASSTRQHARFYTHIRELAISYEGYSEDIALRPPDLSVRGMFINTPHHFPEGAVLKIQFRLASSGYMIHARGEVRYCLPGVGIGVEFLDIPPQAQQAIEQELQKVKPRS
jgi:hypothetical protein